LTFESQRGGEECDELCVMTFGGEETMELGGDREADLLRNNSNNNVRIHLGILAPCIPPHITTCRREYQSVARCPRNLQQIPLAQHSDMLDIFIFTPEFA
jgi:hypothetical protein